ncbi:hypothetical protein GCM10009105_20560 [Dokdonella soli]|uniref:Phasin family protein n=2 Tax=Dokdonella soli TaxID=529810 RepID=A0ABN1IJB1_9GAMM
MLGPMQKAELETDKEIARALKEGHDLYGVHITDLQKLTDALAKQKPDLLAINAAIIANEAAIKNVTKAQEEYQRIAESGLTSLTDAFGQFFTG